VPAIALAGPGDAAGPGAVRDIDGTLIVWLRQKKAAAVVLRPDGFIYAAAESGQRLPAPPAGYELAPTRTGAHT
jgi:3-(3-hydroxy-phenyl)propionate hydroxylase